MQRLISLKHLVAMTTDFRRALAATIRCHGVKVAVGGGLLLFWLAGVPTASAGDACCTVTSITKAGEITAKETNGERTFRFKVADPSLRRGLRVGSPVYANFKTRRVSLDGKKACCNILDMSSAAQQPEAAPADPRASKSLAGDPDGKKPLPGVKKSIPGTTEGVNPRATTLPKLSFGTPQTVPSPKLPSKQESAQILRQFQNTQRIELRGIDAIKNIQPVVPQAAKDILLVHARTLEAQELDSYIVDPEAAIEWSKTLPDSVREKLRKAAEDTGKKKKKKGCSTKHISTGCVKNEVDQAVDDVAKTARKAWKDIEDEWGRFMANVEDAAQCFKDRRLAATVPMKFSMTPQIPMSFEKTAEKGGASGSVSGNVTVGVPVNADFMVDASVFYIPCVPFAVRPRALGADGTLEVGGTFDAGVTATGQFHREFTVPPGGGVQIPVAVVPILLGGVPIAVLDVSVYLDGTLEVDGKGTLNGNLKVQSMQTSVFDFECSGHGCNLKKRSVPAPATAVESVQLDGRIRIKPAIYTALQLGLNVNLLNARAGPQPYLLGEVSGCAAATGAQSTDGTSTAQGLHALTADLDWGIELRAEALAGGQKVAQKKWTLKEEHLYFKDLANSTALMPSVAGTLQPSAGQPAVYTMKMPTCYPYTDRMEYRVRWTGGAGAATGAANSRAMDPRASMVRSVPSTCTVQTGQGTCQGAPLNGTSLSLAWPTAGDYNLTVIPVEDKHGRKFDASRATQMTISVQP